MITSIEEIKPSPFAINQVRVSVDNLGADLKYHLKNIGVSEKYYHEAANFIKSHFKDYEKWLNTHENELF